MHDGMSTIVHLGSNSILRVCAMGYNPQLALAVTEFYKAFQEAMASGAISAVPAGTKANLFILK